LIYYLELKGQFILGITGKILYGIRDQIKSPCSDLKDLKNIPEIRSDVNPIHGFFQSNMINVANRVV